MKFNLRSCFLILILCQGLISLGQTQACDAGYYMKDNQCVSCGVGMGSQPGATSSNDCFSCDYSSHCNTCTDAGYGSCTSCKAGWMPTAQGTCNDCSGPYTEDKCKECTADGKCAVCENPYFANPSQACYSCFPFTYPDSNTTQVSECKDCEDSQCIACSGPGTGKCITCNYNVLDNGQCFSCGPGKYIASYENNNAWEDCQDCPAGCDQCFGTYCDTCFDGYWLDQDNRKCKKCQDTYCVSCTAGGYAKCSQCEEGFFLTARKVCGSCIDENCWTCDKTTGICTQCQVGFYVADDNSCQYCEHLHCQACGSDGKCATCAEGYYMAEDETCTVCDVENCG